MGARKLNILAGCRRCGRQYNATGYPSGSRFRCHCGAVVTVSGESKGMESRVVRCSACGAARRGGAGSCSYCKADFTLHERDMHTICPKCTTRISDKAQYCHSCGVHIDAEEAAGTLTKRTCPVCGKDAALRSRRVGGRALTLLECASCAGMWVSHRVFGRLKRAAEIGTHPGQVPRDIKPGDKKKSREGPFYRICPFCAEMMHRKNFAGISTVIIDACAKHGLWFDDAELANVLTWIKKGGLQQARLQEGRGPGRRPRPPHALGLLGRMFTAKL